LETGIGNSAARAGGGGGGAGTAGKANSNGGAGGEPWEKASKEANQPTDALWIKDATELPIEAFSRGGNGGYSSTAVSGGTPGVNYGDGGSASNNTELSGGAGHSGIVVIRFPRTIN
jgi:hypothetical protein